MSNNPLPFLFNIIRSVLCHSVFFCSIEQKSRCVHVQKSNSPAPHYTSDEGVIVMSHVHKLLALAATLNAAVFVVEWSCRSQGTKSQPRNGKYP